MQIKSAIIEMLLIVVLMIGFFSSEKSGTFNTITLLTIAFFSCKSSQSSQQHSDDKHKNQNRNS